MTRMPTGDRYVRKEDAETRAFYKSYAPLFKRTPDEIAFFVEALRQRTDLQTTGDSFPVDSKTVRSTAAAFIEAARSVYGFSFNLRSGDPSQLDRFVDAHMIDAEGGRVPNEPHLYYAMGCFWGEWLCRHRSSAWALHAPLNPLQSFPDAIGVSNTICMQPFSHATKKLADPEGDNLAYKSDIATSDKRKLPPFPLIASIADADQSVRDLLPPSAAASLNAWEKGDERAFRLFVLAIQETPDNPRILDHAVGCAWDLERWDDVANWLDRLIQLCPDRPHFQHNRAVIFTGSADTMPRAIELLENALRIDPAYARAHLTLASCYHDVGRNQEAIRHCQWVMANDDELKADATELLKEIRSGRR